jgi:citronellol/citronellal dehydrogenase
VYLPAEQSDAEDAKRAVEAEGRKCLLLPGDVTDATFCRDAVERTVAAYGRLDVLVNNAAVTFVGDLDIPLHRHELVMAINLTAPLVASRAAVPHLRAAGGGRILNVSSVAALVPYPGLMSYGIAKIGLERLTVDLARQLQGDGIAVSCFRIDLPVASEGFVANTPGVDRSTWEPCEVAAEGIRWMLEQPTTYSGRRESMLGLRQREGIMPSRAERPTPEAAPITELHQGLAADGASVFAEPYDEEERPPTMPGPTPRQ